jgi:orotate phosphoribosyltransferase-like protein
MGRSREAINEQCQKVKELYCKGYTAKEIAQAIGVSTPTVYNSFTIMGMSLRRSLIDENKIVYADNRVILEKIVINGKRYIDITPLFAPR